jgi:ribosome-binding factor A
MKDFANRKSRRGSLRAQGDSFNDVNSTFGPAGRGRRDQKTAQLCRQVFRALSLALGESSEEVVRELVLHDVTPAPDASRLLVRVGLPAHVGVAEALDGLERARGFLRREVAAAITRKRAPELLFVLVPTDVGGRAPGEVRP